MKPAFLITVDTEGDDAWVGSRAVSTNNAAYLPRFQGLCETFGMRPTYLTNWEMARSETFREFGRHVVAAGLGEIGMHLHAWSSPPLGFALTAHDHRCQPYLFEFPEVVMRAKIAAMTAELEDAFAVAMVSHRAGRWGLDGRYARLLSEAGYTVDCSVTPGWSWQGAKGAFAPGPDFREAPAEPYFLATERGAGASGLLEVPMTILPPQPGVMPELLLRGAHRLPPLRRLTAGRLPTGRWLRQFGPHARGALVSVLQAATREGCSHVELMLHSSELMPGGSPYFRDAPAIERLYEELTALFEAAAEYEPATLAEFRTRFEETAAEPPVSSP